MTSDIERLKQANEAAREHAHAAFCAWQSSQSALEFLGKQFVAGAWVFGQAVASGAVQDMRATASACQAAYERAEAAELEASNAYLAALRRQRDELTRAEVARRDPHL